MQALGNLLGKLARFSISALRRLWFVWLRIYKQQGRRGKVVFGCASFFGACVVLSICSSLILPPGTSEDDVAEGSRVEEIDLDDAPDAETESMAQVVESPTETAVSDPTEPAATATNTLAPTAEPTETLPPTSTNTPKPTNTRPPTNTPQPTNTAVPPTNTRPPATAVPPTAVPPTAVPLPTNTPAPTAVPTQPPPPTAAPAPTEPPAVSSSDVKIVFVRFNGDINPSEPDEYAVIQNTGAGTINLNGWRLNAGNPGQDFTFPSIDLGPGQSCRVYTNQVNPDSCGGGSFGSGSAIWSNSGDCGYLFDSTNAQVSQYCYNG